MTITNRANEIAVKYAEEMVKFYRFSVRINNGEILSSEDRALHRKATDAMYKAQEDLANECTSIARREVY